MTDTIYLPTIELMSDDKPKKQAEVIPAPDRAEVNLMRQQNQIAIRNERMARLYQNPELMNTICNHISNGGSLISLCRIYECHYSQLKGWINRDPERRKLYEEAVADRKEWAADKIVTELTDLSYTNFKAAFNQDGTLKNPHEMPENIAKLITSFKVMEEFEGSGKERLQVGFTKEVKFIDRLKAIELLGKQAGSWLQKVEHSGSVKLEDLLAESWEDDET